MENLVKAGELARRWGVSRSWVYRAADSGRLPSLRLAPGGPLRFRPVDIDAFERQARRTIESERISDDD